MNSKKGCVLVYGRNWLGCCSSVERKTYKRSATRRDRRRSKKILLRVE